MWDRKQLKAQGKAAFKRNYWKAVLVALIATLMVSAAAGSSASNSVSNIQQQQALLQESQQGELSMLGDEMLIDNYDPEAEQSIDVLPDEFSGLIADNEGAAAETPAAPIRIAGSFSLIGLLITLLVFNPLDVGVSRFFRVNSDNPAELGELGYGFKSNYGNIVVTILLESIFLFLWTLLFIIPGIIKSYSYRMVPYILTDNPDMKPTEAITLSRKMMNGSKWRAFVLDLSFLGWEILNLFTLGLLGVFFVNPYKQATNAELYKALKGDDAPAEQPVEETAAVAAE